MSAQVPTTSAFEAVPQLDLAAQSAAIGAEIRTAVERVMASQEFILGREGATLEQKIAKLCAVAHGVGVACGTDALVLALRTASDAQTPLRRKQSKIYTSCPNCLFSITLWRFFYLPR